VQDLYQKSAATINQPAKTSHPTDQANMGEPANTMHMGVMAQEWSRQGRSHGVGALGPGPRMICNLTLNFLNLIKLLDKLALLAAPLTMKKMNS